MNQSTIKRIAVIRGILRADPATVVAGDLRPGSHNPSSGVQTWDEFLAIMNGGSQGAFDIWSNEELPENQFYATTMPGGRNRWLVIGQLLYEPIALNRATAEIRYFPEAGDSVVFGDIDRFVGDILLGNKYCQVVPKGDRTLGGPAETIAPDKLMSVQHNALFRSIFGGVVTCEMSP